jgi:hypothetical protein
MQICGVSKPAKSGLKNDPKGRHNMSPIWIVCPGRRIGALHVGYGFVKIRDRPVSFRSEVEQIS